MANITILGSGKTKRYKVMYDVPAPKGTRRRKSKTFPPGTPKSLVDKFKLEKEIESAAGEIMESEITLKDFVETVYFPIYTKELSPTTLKGYRSVYDNSRDYCIKAYFGDFKMRDISMRMVQQYVNLISDLVNPKTVRSYISFLHIVFSYAITEEVIKRKNPTENVRLPRNTKTEPEFFTLEQILTMLELSEDDLNAKLIIGLGALAGLRRGEMAGLKWSNVSIEEDDAYIRIKAAIVKDGKKEFVKAPKTAAGDREIPIPGTLADILKEVHVEYLKNKLRLGKDFADEGYVLVSEKGIHYTPSTIDNHYRRKQRKINEATGIPVLSLHKLRHTYATLLIDGGANPKVVQKNLGHEDVTLTLGLYSHAYAARQREEVDKLDSLIKLKSGTC